MKIIFLGAPGAGKGTQAEVVSRYFGIPTISTGAIIRQALKDETPMGLAAKEFIEKEYGEGYIPRQSRVYKGNANAQDAHEAIRPSNVNLTPKLIKGMLTNDQYKIYKLIWERFVASQMESAVLDTVSVEIENSGYVFRTGGYTIDFRGYLAVYTDSFEESMEDGDEMTVNGLPLLKKSEVLKNKSVVEKQHFTEPLPRYTEASLIKFLEENGIGRPSTYAPIISILTTRRYVKRDGKSLVATPLGEITVSYMRENFPEIIDYEFTASLESRLDSIEHSKESMEDVLTDFYGRFEKELADASLNNVPIIRIVKLQ